MAIGYNFSTGIMIKVNRWIRVDKSIYKTAARAPLRLMCHRVFCFTVRGENNKLCNEYYKVKIKSRKYTVFLKQM